MTMKKLLTLLPCLLLCLIGASAQGSDSAASSQESSPAAWYELSAEDTVLTVSLPIDTAGASWHFQIGNETMIELLSCEVLGDEASESDAAWVGSFASFSAQQGSTVIQFTLSDSEGAHLKAHLLSVEAAQNGALSVKDVVENSFYYLNEYGDTLHAALPANITTGYSWSYCFSDPEILTCASEEYISAESSEITAGAGGTWTAVFCGTFQKAGEVTLTLNYARPWESVHPIESHTISLFVNEANYIELLPQQSEEDPFSSGSYGDEYFNVSLIKDADGSYSAKISIYRLTLQDDGRGYYEDGALYITATDAAGDSMKWKFTKEGPLMTAEVIDSTWSLLPTGEKFTFASDKTE